MPIELVALGIMGVADQYASIADGFFAGAVAVDELISCFIHGKEISWLAHVGRTDVIHIIGEGAGKMGYQQVLLSICIPEGAYVGDAAALMPDVPAVLICDFLHCPWAMGIGGGGDKHAALGIHRDIDEILPSVMSDAAGVDAISIACHAAPAEIIRQHGGIRHGIADDLPVDQIPGVQNRHTRCIHERRRNHVVVLSHADRIRIGIVSGQNQGVIGTIAIIAPWGNIACAAHQNSPVLTRPIPREEDRPCTFLMFTCGIR